MWKCAIWFSFVFVAVGSVGPVVFLVSNHDKADLNDLYVFLDVTQKPETHGHVADLGGRWIGPERKRFAGLIQATPEALNRLRGVGYVLLPAGALVALCGPLDPLPEQLPGVL